MAVGLRKTPFLILRTNKKIRKNDHHWTNYVILEDKLRKIVMAKKILKVSEPAAALYQKAKISVEDILRLDLADLDEPLSRLDTFRNGLDKNAFESFKALSGLDYETLADALGVSAKTLQRKEVFDTGQSEKLYQLSELYAIGINYFGREGFRRWMERPLFTLGHRVPLDLIDVSEGISLLKTEIMRLQHGIAV